MMTPDEFVEALRLRGLTGQYNAASALGVNQASISRWSRGVEKVPRYIEHALNGMPYAPVGEPVTVKSQRDERRSRKSSNGGA